jgi:hypothetical protein
VFLHLHFLDGRSPEWQTFLRWTFPLGKIGIGMLFLGLLLFFLLSLWKEMTGKNVTRLFRLPQWCSMIGIGLICFWFLMQLIDFLTTPGPIIHF